MSREKRARLSVSFRSQPSFLLLAKERQQKQQQTRASFPPPVAKWPELPLELVVAIASYLPPKDRLSLFLVCRSWSAAAGVPSLWSSSWISIRPNLFSKPQRFWELLQSRSICRVRLHGYTLADENKLSMDLFLLSSNAPQLRALHVDCGGRLEATMFKHILHFNHLTDLKLDFRKCLYTSIVVVNHLILKNLTNLKDLSLVGVADMGYFDMSFLSHPTLLSLSLDTCGSFKAVTTNNLISLFPRLKRLVIKNCVYYYAFIAEEKRNASFRERATPSLTDVSLIRTSFDGSLCKFPTWFFKLESLSLHFCQQSPVQLSAVLAQLNSLVSLNLAGNFCSNETLLSLASSSLRSLDLSYNQDITVTGLHYLSSVAKDTLTDLSLSHCSGLVSMREKASIILPSLFPKIQQLNLCGWNLPLHRMKLLFSQCPHLTQLQCNNTEDASPKLLLTSNHHFIRNTTTNTQTETV